MPSIYLSPSLQDHHLYAVGAGNEEIYMNQIADAMIPELRRLAVTFCRNNPFDTLSQIIARSNAGVYDLHLALHSNTSPAPLSGLIRGPDIYYYGNSPASRLAGEIFAHGLKTIYPNPGLVALLPNQTLTELNRTNAPSILIELAYHDNCQDANWIISHIKPIAQNLVQSLIQYQKVCRPSHAFPV